MELAVSRRSNFGLDLLNALNISEGSRLIVGGLPACFLAVLLDRSCLTAKSSAG